MEAKIKGFTSGSLVCVGPAYRMGGRYEADGTEGLHTVMGGCKYGNDYFLLRGDMRYLGNEYLTANKLDYDVCIHMSRLNQVGNHGE